MLSIKSKIIYPTEIRTPFIEYIKTNYSKNINSLCCIEKFIQLRTNIGNINKNKFSYSISLLYYYQYYKQLMDMEIQFNEYPLLLPFSWYDSFLLQYKIQNNTLKYEQSVILYNIGAFESQYGYSMDRSTSEGIKLACQHFMKAAGIFYYINETYNNSNNNNNTNETITPDLLNDSLLLLYNLMLAQAQTCYYEKSVKDKLKHSIKSKLAMQSIEYYEKVIDYTIHHPNLLFKNILNKDWIYYFKFQIICLKCASEYWESRSNKENALIKGFGYGEEITRLRLAFHLCNDGILIIKNNKLPSNLLQSIQEFKNIIENDLKLAEKENISIYMEKIPNYNELKIIDKIVMAKFIPFHINNINEDLKDTTTDNLNYMNLFENIVSNSFINNIKENKNKLINEINYIIDTIIKYNKDSKDSILIFHPLLTIEKCNDININIHNYQNNKEMDIPDEIWYKIKDKNDKNIIQEIENLFLMTRNHIEKCNYILRLCENILKEEEIQDNLYRQKYILNNEYKRLDSYTLNKNFHLNIDHYYKLLRESEQLNKLNYDRFSTNKDSFNIIYKSRKEIQEEMILNKLTFMSNNDNNNNNNHLLILDTTTLSNLLLQFDLLINEREKEIIQNLLNIISNVNSSSFSLINNNENNNENKNINNNENNNNTIYNYHEISTILTNYYKLVQDLKNKDKQSIIEIDLMIQSIKIENDTLLYKLNNNLNNDSFIIKLNELYTNINNSINTLDTIYNNIKENELFFNSFIHKIEQFKQTIHDHCTARTLEKRDFELNINLLHNNINNENKDNSVSTINNIKTNSNTKFYPYSIK